MKRNGAADAEETATLPVLLLTVQQAAAVCQVSTDQIYRWTYEPDFPVIAQPHAFRIHARLLDQWLIKRANQGRKEEGSAA
jgi:predicted DNA-binding transcriptional regulator AlpA